MRPIARPNDFVDEYPTLIDNKALWHALDVVEMGSPVLRVEQGRKGQLVLLHERGDDLGHQSINTDRQDFQTPAVEPLVQPLHGRHFLDTGGAPGRPDIDEYHLASQRRELHQSPLEIRQRKIRQRLAKARGSMPGVRRRLRQYPIEEHQEEEERRRHPQQRHTPTGTPGRDSWYQM